MREMENIPRDSQRRSNILVDDDDMGNNQNQENIYDNMINPQDINLNIQIKENPLFQNDYLFEMLQKNFIINIIILSSLIVLIILDLIYRNSLFTYSLTYEQNLQNTFSKSEIQFYKIISNILGYVIIVLGFIFVFCYFPLNKSILLFITFIFGDYIEDLMKLIFSDPRPFWLNSILSQGSCEGSYGNPSGHSIKAFLFSLSLCYYICMLDRIKNNLKYKTIIYSIGLFSAGLVAFSRIALGVHSIDQVLFGSLIGMWIFIVFAYVFKIYDMPLSYYLKFFREKKYINYFIIILSVLFIFPIIIYLLIDVESDFKKYDLVMSKKCPNKKQYTYYSHKNMAGSLIILLIFGIYLGQFLFWYIIKNNNYPTDDSLIIEESINNWNNFLKEMYSSIGNITKIIGLFGIALSPLIVAKLISGKSSLSNIFIFKYSIPYLLTGFLAFGPCLYSFIHILKEKRGSFTN